VHVQEDRYPEYWPVLAQAEAACPTLSGRYDDRDVNEREPRRLAKWLLDTTASLGAVHRVELAGPVEGVLEVRFIDADGNALLTRALQADTDFTCAQGWLVRQPAGLTVIGVAQDHQVRFGRTVRGDLVVEDRERAGGVMIAVPLYLSTVGWHLYRQRR
jgi:hypothetical protein